MPSQTFQPSTPVKPSSIRVGGAHPEEHGGTSQPALQTEVPEALMKAGRGDGGENFAIDMHDSKNLVSEKATNLKLVAKDALTNPTTKLGRETEFHGDYKSTKAHAGVAVAGKIAGAVALAEGSVFHLEAGAEASKFRIEAETVVIAGQFSGEIVAGTLEILPGAVVEGKITYVEICIQRGAKVNAEHRMIS